MKYTRSEKLAILIYIISVLVQLSFFGLIIYYFLNIDLTIISLFLVIYAVLAIVYLVIDVIGTFSNPLEFEPYGLDYRVADLFERKMKVIDTDVCGYAKGYVVRYNRENKERQTLIYMYNDKLYPVEDVLFCGRCFILWGGGIKCLK